MGGVVEAFVPARLGTGFRRLLASSWVTNLGDGIAVAAGPLLVASLTSDPFLISLAALLRWAPPLAFGLYAGVLSDRLDRRRLIVAANVVRAVVLAFLVATVAVGTATVVTVLVGLGLLATAEVFVDNTSATLLPMLVDRNDLAIANARLQTGFITMNHMCGPAVGAALFAAGRSWPFLAQTVLVVAGAALLSRIALPAHGRNGASSGSIRRDVVQGLRWTASHAAVRTLAVTILVFNVTFGAAWSVLVLYATERLGMGAIGFGLLTTVSAVGGLAGTALYGRITRRFSLGGIMRVGLIVETFTHLALAVTTSPTVALLIFFVFGAHVFVWGTTSVTIRQRAVPSGLQGRVGSVYTICVYAGLVSGSVVGGVLASHFGVAAPFWFAFAGSALLVLVMWPQLRLIAHAEQHAPPADRGARR